MDYSLTRLPNSELEIRVTLPFSEFEPHIKRAAVFISEKREFEGFRKGKAPYEIVKVRMGEDVIYEEAAEIAIRKTYPEILEEILEKKRAAGEDFSPIGRPEITVTKIAPANELEYKVKLAILPKVDLPDYKKIAASVSKEKKGVEVTDEEIDKAIDWVRESRASVITVDRAAASGDLAEVDLEIRQGQAQKFLQDHNKVRIELPLTGRERQYKDRAKEVIQGFIQSLGDNIVVEGSMEWQFGKLMVMVYQKQV